MRNQGEALIRFFSLSHNWLMGEIITNIQTMILYLCKTLEKLKTFHYEIGASILYEDIFIINLFKIFPEINRLKTRVWREKHCTKQRWFCICSASRWIVIGFVCGCSFTWIASLDFLFFALCDFLLDLLLSKVKSVQLAFPNA